MAEMAQSLSEIEQKQLILVKSLIHLAALLSKLS